jgi:flavin reductase (DIM6/NTAB) family NADH-FMN oxidoreductase RutF
MAAVLEQRSFDLKAFRNALGSFATGVTLVTTRTPSGEPIGLTANSFNSVSLEPPLVLWSQALSSSRSAAFLNADFYAINVLASHQLEISRRFVASGSFEGLEFEEGLGGAPLRRGSCAIFECRSEARHPGGDHVIHVGRVERFHRVDADPLAFHAGRYRRLDDLRA